jgi:hypothetical protein
MAMEDLNVGDYLETISAYETEFKEWEGRVEKIVKRYRDDKRDKNNTGAKFNILWSNINTLVPAVFAKLPRPDVSRRFRDQDTVGRVAGLLLERTLTYEIDCEDDYQQALKNCVFDRFLGGRGQAWVRYEPRFDKGEFEVTEDAENEAQDVLAWEHTPVDYVHWRDFGHSIARTWEEVTCVWRKVYMSRDALVERFGEDLGNKIPLDTRPEDLKKAGVSVDTKNAQAAIYEVWDKSAGIACWLSKSMNEILDEKADPLKLTGFWPCPRPLFGTITTDSLTPLPDFTLYQDQANELDLLSDRIDGLIKALKVRGVYDAATPELSRLFTEGENNTLIPVKNWAAFVEKQGLKGAIDIVDLQPIAEALKLAYEASEQVKGQIYEITGISDIVRGDTDANETASAQKLKASYGNLRLKSAQQEVARFATELLQIKAQIICNFYSEQTILQASAAEQMQQVDQQAIQPALQLLKNNALRTFRIDIEADSMVQLDEDKLKADRLEFLGAVSNFLKETAEAAQTSPQIVPLAMEMLKFGAGAFKAGKQLEGVIDQTAEQLKQQIAQQQQNPKPDPEMMKVQAQQQLEQFKAQTQAQASQQQAMLDFKVDQQRVQSEKELELFRQQVQAEQVAHQNQIEAQREAMQADNDAKLEQMRQMHDAALEQSRQQFELLIARINNAAKVEVAEIAAQTTLDAAQISQANQASD